jgi:hypothetical protein
MQAKLIMTNLPEAPLTILEFTWKFLSTFDSMDIDLCIYNCLNDIFLLYRINFKWILSFIYLLQFIIKFEI